MSVERLDGGYRSQLQVQGEEKLIVTLTALILQSNMNLTDQTVMRFCYKPGKVLSNARWERTLLEGRLTRKAFRTRHEVSRNSKPILVSSVL